jgi:hypothetical protein
VLGVLSEALTADVQVILADDTMTVVAHAADFFFEKKGGSTKKPRKKISHKTAPHT